MSLHYIDKLFYWSEKRVHLFGFEIKPVAVIALLPAIEKFR